MLKRLLIVLEVKKGIVKTLYQEMVYACCHYGCISGYAVGVFLYGVGIPPRCRDELARAGADAVWYLEDESLCAHNPELILQPIVDLIGRESPQLVLLTNTSAAMDIAPRLAERCSCTLLSNVCEIKLCQQPPSFTRTVYEGRLLETCSLKLPLTVVTASPNAIPVVAKVNLQIGNIDRSIAIRKVSGFHTEELTYRVRETITKCNQIKPLTEADIIVSGGKGLNKAEDFALLDELAQVLGGAVGVSRPVVDCGWRPYQFQVGQTGTRVQPKVYIACGISGAMQHIIGMSDSRIVIAINRDPEAPIFQYADYGVVGDLYEILPIFTSRLQSALNL
ncbi:MAG: etfA [Anaerosporomusa subterranea]|jgi:electron transfer flavoprotein alpha subunit|nr:etfA [Anaerosporomusa subterranea]